MRGKWQLAPKAAHRFQSLNTATPGHLRAALRTPDLNEKKEMSLT